MCLTIILNLLSPARKCHASGEPGEGRRARQADGQDHVYDAAAFHDRAEDKAEQDGGEGAHRVDYHGEHTVDRLAGVAGYDADYGADDRRNEHRKQADGEGDARAVEHAAEHGAAEDVGAEPVGRGGAGEGVGRVHGGMVIGAYHIPENREEHDEKEHRSAEYGGFSLGEPLYPSATLGHRLFFSAVHVETPPNICADILISPRR